LSSSLSALLTLIPSDNFFAISTLCTPGELLSTDGGLLITLTTTSSDVEDDNGTVFMEISGILTEFGFSFVLGEGVSGGGGVSGGFSLNDDLFLELQAGDNVFDGNTFMSSNAGLL